MIAFPDANGTHISETTDKKKSLWKTGPSTTQRVANLPSCEAVHRTACQAHIFSHEALGCE